MYKISILSDKDFDQLPYSEAQVSLGLADTNKKEAYVRYTHSDRLTKELVNHEFEHLIGENKDELHHGGDGVYYKGLGNVFSAVMPAFAGAGRSIAGAGSSIIGGATGFPSQLGGLAKGFGGFGGAPQRATSQLMGGLSSRAMQNPSLRAPADFFKGAGNMVSKSYFPGVSTMGRQLAGGQSAMNRFSSAPSSFGGQLGRTPSPMKPPGGGGFFQGIGNAIKGIGRDIFGGFGGGGEAGGEAGGGKFNLGKTLLGGGISMLGNFAGGQPKVPDIGQLSSVQALRGQKFNNINELDPALVAALNRDYDRTDTEEKRDLMLRYKGLRPGADIESDSAFKKDLMELQRSQGVRRGDQLAKHRFEFITNNLQMNQQEIGRLTELANMDIGQIMLQLGLDARGANNFKQTFGDIGQAFMSSGLGLQSSGGQSPININVGGSGGGGGLSGLFG